MRAQRKSARFLVSSASRMAGSVRDGMRLSARRKTAGMESSGGGSTYGKAAYGGGIAEISTRLDAAALDLVDAEASGMQAQKTRYHWMKNKFVKLNNGDRVTATGKPQHEHWVHHLEQKQSLRPEPQHRFPRLQCEACTCSITRRIGVLGSCGLAYRCVENEGQIWLAAITACRRLKCWSTCLPKMLLACGDRTSKSCLPVEFARPGAACLWSSHVQERREA